MVDERVEVVRFTADDAASIRSLRRLTTTRHLGLRRFPDPSAYHGWVAGTAGLPEAPTTARLQALAQRDWHIRGQNGCMFAMLAAQRAEALRWDYLVLRAGVPDLRSDDLGAIGQLVRDATRDDGCRVLSILAPLVEEPAQAIDLVRLLTRGAGFWLERDEISERGHRLHLRYPVSAEVQAWVMAFGPFDCLPNTRRGPFFELALRTKQKPPVLFHRLNSDRDVAHLADAELEMTVDLWEQRWQSTLRRTRMILDGEPDTVSAAKATLVVPVTSTVAVTPD